MAKESSTESVVREIRRDPHEEYSTIEKCWKAFLKTIKLRHYDKPGTLEQEIGSFVDHYNGQRVHE